MSKRDMIPIPFVEEYRGVGIHNHQPRARIDGAVKPAIDHVLALSDIDALLTFAADVRNPPEARILAGAKLEASHEAATEERRERPNIDVDYVRAITAGLDSDYWRSPWVYGTLLDTPPGPGEPGPVKREVPLVKK